MALKFLVLDKKDNVWLEKKKRKETGKRSWLEASSKDNLFKTSAYS